VGVEGEGTMPPPPPPPHPAPPSSRRIPAWLRAAGRGGVRCQIREPRDCQTMPSLHSFVITPPSAPGPADSPSSLCASSSSSRAPCTHWPSAQPASPRGFHIKKAILNARQIIWSRTIFFFGNQRCSGGSHEAEPPCELRQQTAATRH
jgi:hypothetical protein